MPASPPGRRHLGVPGQTLICGDRSAPQACPHDTRGDDDGRGGGHEHRGPGAALVGWLLLTPFLLAGSPASTWHLYGEPPSPAEEQQAFLWGLAAAGVALVLPLLGLWLSVGAGRGGSAVCFTIALTVGLALSGLVLAGDGRDEGRSAIPVDRGPVGCQEHSGGDTRCPGG